MKPERYKIITGKGAMSLEEAVQQIKGTIIETCKQGYKLQGGADVKVKQYSNFTWYKIYQTLIDGNQNLTDYDIITVTGLFDSLSQVTGKMMLKLMQTCERDWKLAGGASIDEDYRKGSSSPSYRIYQTIIKEQ